MFATLFVNSRKHECNIGDFLPRPFPLGNAEALNQ